MIGEQTAKINEKEDQRAGGASGRWKEMEQRRDFGYGLEFDTRVAA